MPIDQSSQIVITGFDWVPDFAKGYVRDLRARWACEEAGIGYRTRLISAFDRPEWFYAEQPWGQVPVLKDGDIHLFESGAILLHLGEKDERLLPRHGQARADATGWLFAAYNSVEPLSFEMTRVAMAGDADWAKLREPSLRETIASALDRLQTAIGDREWLAGAFSVADIAMVTVLRELHGKDLLDPHPDLAGYLQRGMARPAFQSALAAQLADFDDSRAPNPKQEA
ncbi:glutathione S-transferase family protein [Croceicoccus bisphenolivorans]|uniref:glutathione S-transferase family protein n=1 Tax=Croceicoccus bisphenolivorans TaxID=1783232 RepID=UPI00082B4F4B|nr:glutathione S-transferase family protein [Croceicoccus bisphenolivorans]